jgi:amidase
LLWGRTFCTKGKIRAINRMLSSAACATAVAITATSGHAQPRPFPGVEATIAAMQAAMAERRVTSRELVSQSLVRIGLYDNRVHAALAVNPRALQQADALDRERAAGKTRGPLHGIPIALKDNIHTTDMPTTGGAGVRRLSAAV